MEETPDLIGTLTFGASRSMSRANLEHKIRTYIKRARIRNQKIELCSTSPWKQGNTEKGNLQDFTDDGNARGNQNLQQIQEKNLAPTRRNNVPLGRSHPDIQMPGD